MYCYSGIGRCFCTEGLHSIMRALSFHTQCCQLLWISPAHFVYALRDQVWCMIFKWCVDVLHCKKTTLVIYFAYLHLAYNKVRQLLVLNRKSKLIHSFSNSRRMRRPKARSAVARSHALSIPRGGSARLGLPLHARKILPAKQVSRL